MFQDVSSLIAFASHKFGSAERNYSTTDRELFALQWAVQKFRPYLFGNHFQIFTDHQPVLGLVSGNPHSSRHVRYQQKLAEYDFDLRYIPGSSNLVADTLSRSHLNHLAPEFIPDVVSPICLPSKPDSSEDTVISKYHNMGHLLKLFGRKFWILDTVFPTFGLKYAVFFLSAVFVVVSHMANLVVLLVTFLMIFCHVSLYVLTLLALSLTVNLDFVILLL